MLNSAAEESECGSSQRTVRLEWQYHNAMKNPKAQLAVDGTASPPARKAMPIGCVWLPIHLSRGGSAVHAAEAWAAGKNETRTECCLCAPGAGNAVAC